MGNQNSKLRSKLTNNEKLKNQNDISICITKEDSMNYIHTTSYSLPPSPTGSAQSNILMFKDSKMNYDRMSDSYIINGRKYQNYNKKYILPFDEQEQDRLTQVHFLYKYLFQSNFSAPINDILHPNYQSIRSSVNSLIDNTFSHQEKTTPKVLDIACGSGSWILEMATEFPESEFYGIDIVASYPVAIKPANAFFSQVDIMAPEGLPYPNEHFDYVHMRQAYSCFSGYEWKIIIEEICRVLKPNGYVEFRDVDPIIKNAGPVSKRFFEKFPRSMEAEHNVNVLWAKHMCQLLQDSGSFSELHQETKPLEFNIEGPIGNMVETSFRFALDSFQMFFEKCNNIPHDRYAEVVNRMVKETVEHNSYFTYYCCWGKKLILNTSENTKDQKGSVPDKLPTSSKEHILSLGHENICDIDQFIQGYED